MGKSLLLAFVLEIIVIIIVDGVGGQLAPMGEAHAGDTFNANGSVTSYKILAHLISGGIVIQGIIFGFMKIWQPEQSNYVRRY